MKELRKFVKNDGTEENIIKGAAKTLGFHTELDSLKRFIKIHSNMANDS